MVAEVVDVVVITEEEEEGAEAALAAFVHNRAASAATEAAVVAISRRRHPTWAANQGSTCPTPWYPKRLPIRTRIRIRLWFHSRPLEVIIITSRNSNSSSRLPEEEWVEAIFRRR